MGATLWIVWAIIGVIGGYMAGKLLHTAHSVVLDVCVWVCAAHCLADGCWWCSWAITRICRCFRS